MITKNWLLEGLKEAPARCADLDHEAAERDATMVVADLTYAEWIRNLARAYQARGERIARLEALVREHAKCLECKGAGEIRYWTDVDEHEMRQCPSCAGTGLVEAARKELENG